MRTLLKGTFSFQVDEDSVWREPAMDEEARRLLAESTKKINKAVAAARVSPLHWSKALSIEPKTQSFDALMEAVARLWVVGTAGDIEKAGRSTCPKRLDVGAEYKSQVWSEDDSTCRFGLVTTGTSVCEPCAPKPCHKVDGKMVEKCPGTPPKLLVCEMPSSKGPVQFLLRFEGELETVH